MSLSSPQTSIIDYIFTPVFNDSFSLFFFLMPTHSLLSVGGIRVLEKNLNLNVTMKVGMTNGLSVKMLLDV